MIWCRNIFVIAQKLCSLWTVPNYTNKVMSSINVSFSEVGSVKCKSYLLIKVINIADSLYLGNVLCAIFSCLKQILWSQDGYFSLYPFSIWVTLYKSYMFSHKILLETDMQIPSYKVVSVILAKNIYVNQFTIIISMHRWSLNAHYWWRKVSNLLFLKYDIII